MVLVFREIRDFLFFIFFRDDSPFSSFRVFFLGNGFVKNIRSMHCVKMQGFLLLLLILGLVLPPAARAFSFTARVSGIPLGARQPSTAHTYTQRQMYNMAVGRCKAVAAQGVRSMVARGDGSDSGAASTDDDWRQAPPILFFLIRPLMLLSIALI